ncbi:MAG: hypothetical protein KAS63_00810 [Candidatus Heimdallarchaeota archaeon]|nr:hypothetical protein [Candidatus Heimdallarchaeota archaeon]MCK4953884.1 hypothetical protein [Candidatus Heimdallarchaeota archaeon]
MIEKNPLNTLFITIRKELFELINMIEVRIDVGYILEEIEEISFEISKLSKEGEKIVKEMKEIYSSLYKKYENKLAAFLSSREANYLVDKIESWLQVLPSLI